MKWLVGLDLRPSSQGAIRWARWLARRTAADSLVGVHVLEEAHLQAALRYHHLAELTDTAREAAANVLADCDATDVLSTVEILQGVHAEGVLQSARESHGADALIVGRQAPREGRRLLRLGRVARRLLRTLDAPVVVVPPDLEPGDAPGPVLACTNLREDTVEAMRFAGDMAARLRVPLVVVYVVPFADDYGAHYIPEASRKKIAQENQTQGEADLKAWLQGCSVAPSEAIVVQGSIVDSVLHIAEARGASLVVSGSRLLSAIERVLLTSIASELAATASCPVAVVPPRLVDR
jgi:nucleotide-binding universal stress UspA family protein